MNRVAKWWDEIGKPALLNNLMAWWIDIEEHPRLHFFSMVFGMLVLSAVKFAVWLVA